MKPTGQAAARRYARALLDVASADGRADALRGELSDAAALVSSHADLERALTHPTVPVETRRRLIGAVWKARGASPLLVRLLELLAERGRMGLLRAIDEAFGMLWNARRGVASARAVTAVALDEKQLRALSRAIAAARRSEVELTTATDPSVVGGLVLTMEGRTYDGSVRAQLQALRDKLSGVRA